MAGLGVSSPGGFSYAQAAKGRVLSAPSQTASSIVASGATTPATGVLSDFDSGTKTNWADDVEMSVAEKLPESRSEVQESKHTIKALEVKGAVERAKSEDKAQNDSGVSSPDIAASATSHDDTSSAQNGSSQTSWDLKSQESEQATPVSAAIEQSGSWIAARAERQSNSTAQAETPVTKGKKKKAAVAEKSPELPPPKPVVLTEAAVPTVNPWAKRAEETKAKMSVLQQNVIKAPGPSTSSLSSLKENQSPRTDPRKKATMTAGLASESSPVTSDNKTKPNTTQGRGTPKAVDEARPISKPSAVADPAVGGAKGESRTPRTERQSQPSLSTAAPFVKDAVAWPTPDTAIVSEKESKAAAERVAEDNDDSAANAGKPRKKMEWKPVPVVPNIVWQTPGVREKTARGGFAGESRGRGGVTLRGRGGARAGSGAVNGERPTSRAAQQIGDEASGRSARRTSDDEAATATKPPRTSSVGSWVEVRKPSVTETEGFTPEPTNESKVAGKKQAVLRPQQKTSKKPDGTAVEGSSNDTVSDTTPRRAHVNGQQSAEQDTALHMPNDPPIRMVASESRKDRNGDNAREANFRGKNARGGRGRGGSREFTNGHHAAHPYTGTSPAADVFGAPQSPSYQTPRGGHRGAFPGSGRGTWGSHNGRAQSIPVEGNYNRYPYTSPAQPYGFDPSGFPISSAAYTQVANFEYIFHLVAMQLEYYFSLDNLLKDTFLRKNMDSQGFVYLDVIAAFNRIKNLTNDKELLRQVCLHSETVEIRIGEDGKERLRLAQNWEQWVMPVEERYPSARVDGPTKLERPSPRYPDVYAPPQMGMQYSMTPSRGGDRHSAESSTHVLMSGAARAAFFPANGYGDVTNGEEMRGRSAKSPIQDGALFYPSRNNSVADGFAGNVDADVFPDQNLEQLTVCVKMDSRRPPYHSAPSRTFSNGSIDTKSIMGEAGKSLDSHISPIVNGERHINGVSPTPEDAIASTSDSSSPERGAATMSVFWIKDNDNPVGTVPSGLFPEPYVQLRHKALDQRSHAATGNCPYDLDVLYQFWSHFLIRNFNNRMYREFKFYAEADAKERHSSIGLTNLVKYYSQALLSPNQIPTIVLKDYISKAKEEASKTDGLVVKQLRSAWRNGALNLRNRKKLADSADEQLMALLEK